LHIKALKSLALSQSIYDVCPLAICSKASGPFQQCLEAPLFYHWKLSSLCSQALLFYYIKLSRLCSRACFDYEQTSEGSLRALKACLKLED
jgi:hypothetical protein